MENGKPVYWLAALMWVSGEPVMAPLGEIAFIAYVLWDMRETHIKTEQWEKEESRAKIFCVAILFSSFALWHDFHLIPGTAVLAVVIVSFLVATFLFTKWFSHQADDVFDPED